MSDRRLVEHWDQMAAKYDKSMLALERRMFGDTRDWVCSRAHGEVLEVAAGTGLNFPHYPRHVRLTAVEWSPAMLELARQRAADVDRDVELVEGDASDLPFEDGSFDTVVCTYAYCCIPDDDRALAEAARVLRPGGKLLLADHVTSSVAPLRWFQRLLDLFSVRRYSEYWTRRPITKLPGHGFEVVESRRHTLGVLERVHAVKGR